MVYLIRLFNLPQYTLKKYFLCVDTVVNIYFLHPHGPTHSFVLLLSQILFLLLYKSHNTVSLALKVDCPLSLKAIRKGICIDPQPLHCSAVLSIAPRPSPTVSFRKVCKV